MDKPKVSIEELNYPQRIKFDQRFKVSFLLKRISSSTPRRIVIMLNGEDMVKSFELSELDLDREFIINLVGSELTSYKNDFVIQVFYKDEEGSIYKSEKSFSVELSDLTITQKVILFLNSIGSTLDEFDLRVLIIAAFTFGIVAGFVLRKTTKEKA